MTVRSLAMAAALATTCTAAGQTPVGASREQQAMDFLTRLQRAVDSNDQPAMSRLFQFPFTVLASGLRIPIQNRQALAEMYHVVFTPEMRCRIDQSGIARSGRPLPTHPVALSNDSLVLGGGLVWATRVDEQWKITRVVVPPSFASRPRTSRVPRALRFDRDTAGARVASSSDWLNRDETHIYIVRVEKGHLLHVRLDGFQGLAAAVFVARPESKKVASAEPPTRRRTVRIADGGAYHIEVVRLATYCDPPFQYKLFITVSE